MTPAKVKKLRVIYNNLETLLIMPKNHKKFEMTIDEHQQLSHFSIKLLKFLTEQEKPYRAKKIPFDDSEIFGIDNKYQTQQQKIYEMEGIKLVRQDLRENGKLNLFNQGYLNGLILDIKNSIKNLKKNKI